MAEIAAFFAVTLALFTLVLNFGLKKATRKKKFPTCYRCGIVMRQFPVLNSKFPKETQEYLDEHELPPQVVRYFRCPKLHKELWIAPPVSGKDKGVFVTRDLD